MTLNIFYITVIAVIVIDNTDVISHLKRLISRILTDGVIDTDDYELKPFDCSLCCSFWANVIYLIATGNFSLYSLMITLLFSFLTTTFNIIINAIKDIIETAILYVKSNIVK